MPESSSVKSVSADEPADAEGLRRRGGPRSQELYPGVPEVLQGIAELEPDDPRQARALIEGAMDVYEGTYDDYLEVFIQFGYVFLFSAVYPQAALWALINNLAESRVDAFKLCRLYQRPLARRVKDTGAWQVRPKVRRPGNLRNPPSFAAMKNDGETTSNFGAQISKINAN